MIEKGDIVECYDQQGFVGISTIEEIYEVLEDKTVIAWCHDKHLDKLNYQFHCKPLKSTSQ
jgi:hypothetical protein